jgi:DNA-binding Lrp family transcriptional regulator
VSTYPDPPNPERPKRELELMDQVRAEREALELRLGHWSYRDIAEIQQVSVPTVRARIRRAIQAGIPKETRDQARRLETTRIDTMQRFNQMVIESPSTTIAEKMAAEAMWFRGLEARAKLLGLNVLVELEVKYSGALDHEIEQLMATMHAQAEFIESEDGAEQIG